MDAASPPRRALFVVLATANSGGYRYGVSDQAFYVPAIAMSADPTLFPRDRPLFAPQMRLWLGDSVFGWLASATGSIPAVFAAMYVATLIVLFAAAISFGRGLGAAWPAVAAFAALLTFRHRIAKTGANSLEGYIHPRMLAFAIGIAAFACLVTRRRTAAIVAVARRSHRPHHDGPVVRRGDWRRDSGGTRRRRSSGRADGGRRRRDCRRGGSS